jgi:hypothetical protein
MIIAAGSTIPKILTNFTAMIFAVMRQEMKIAVIAVNLGDEGMIDWLQNVISSLITMGSQLNLMSPWLIISFWVGCAQ